MIVNERSAGGKGQATRHVCNLGKENMLLPRQHTKVNFDILNILHYIFV